MKKFTLILLDISGSISMQSKAKYAEYLPSIVNVCQPRNRDKHNILLVPATFNINLEKIIQCQCAQDLFNNLPRIQALGADWGGVGSDLTANIKAMVDLANQRDIEIEKILFLTDGYDYFAPKSAYDKELKSNPNLNLTLIIEKVFLEQNSTKKVDGWLDVMCMEDTRIESDIINEKPLLEKAIKPLNDNGGAIELIGNSDNTNKSKPPIKV